MLNHGNTLVQLLHYHYPPVSANQLFHLPHSCTWSGIICNFWTSLREFIDPVINRFTWQTVPKINRKHLFMNIFCTESFAHKKRTTEHFSSVAILTTETSPWTCTVDLLPRLSWSWTVLVPSDTYTKSIMSITAVLLPFVTYLLTLPCTYPMEMGSSSYCIVCSCHEWLLIWVGSVI
jgi:hypothetical protein